MSRRRKKIVRVSIEPRRETQKQIRARDAVRRLGGGPRRLEGFLGVYLGTTFYGVDLAKPGNSGRVIRVPPQSVTVGTVKTKSGLVGTWSMSDEEWAKTAKQWGPGSESVHVPTEVTFYGDSLKALKDEESE